MLKQLNKNLAGIEEWAIEVRRQLHQIPEISLDLPKTTDCIIKILNEIGLDINTALSKTGVVADLKTNIPGPVIVFRADMDALPIKENTGLYFSSLHENASHACGHDGHMAMVLGTAKLLYSVKEKLSGTIRFVFQPGEEDVSGAKIMIKEGVLENPEVDYCFGTHIWPAIEKGKVGIKSGPLMAAMSSFELHIHGKGGHGAMPHLCVDAVEIGAQVVSALQRITSRQINPIEPCVVSIGKFHSESSTMNIISGNAWLNGTLRTFSKQTWLTWEERLNKIIDGVCSSMGADFSLDFDLGSPPVYNNIQATEIAITAASKFKKAEELVTPDLTMGGEDFAFFLEKVKGCFIFLGSGIGNNPTPLHNSQYYFPEEVMIEGIKLNCLIAFDILAG